VVDRGRLLCSFSFATTRWHFRFSPVYDVYLYEGALAVVLTGSESEFVDALNPLANTVARHDARVAEKSQLGVETVVAQDEGNRLIPWIEVVSARLHKRRLGVSRLVLNLSDGTTLKLIWMPRGPLAKMSGPVSEVADALRRVLGARVTIE
jgi:hypothetical protein